ncbi:PEP/pyruvate-binding domain-containing protein [Candidatus Tisiphia endosymbiont of Temnostethus pusillus]|uniref:PEP/pyruvate-binding domain-containing protein n=1 Tax=Candidatus Tisiphia endosymbiont of Temnostethus pusillus TaxID=3139335 RepID=UPI0035C8CF60
MTKTTLKDIQNSGVSLSKTIPQYPNEVKKAAIMYGNKAANLMYLKEKLLPEFLIQADNNDSFGIKIQIPEFLKFSHDTIFNYLKSHNVDIEQNWSKFVEFFNKQSNKETIDDNAKQTLQDIKDSIKQCFSENTINLDGLNSFISDLGPNSYVMFRSTGREDSEEFANPGGNISSISSSVFSEINQPIADVIAGYFDEKSLSQRLKAGDDITKLPFVPLLAQLMIHEEDESIVVSGVAYSGRGTTTINAAFGHGEYVVNSKGPSHSFYITENNMVYPTKSPQDYRLQAKINNGKLSLDTITNTNNTKYADSLPAPVSLYLHKFAQFVKEKYSGMEVDVEFVYDPKDNKISIVQVRSKPDGDRTLQQPSALSPEFLIEIAEDGGKILKGSTITQDINNCQLIKEAKEILVFNNINEALGAYLSSANEVKAVIIRNDASPNSHEAGEFAFKGIPVIRIKDLDKVKELVQELNVGKPLVVDPQHKYIVQLPRAYETLTYKNLQKDGFIVPGIFSSTLSPHVSPYSYKLKHVDTTNDDVINTDNDKLGDLVVMSNSPDESLAQQASTNLFQLLKTLIFKNNTTKSAGTYAEILEKLDCLSNPTSANINEVQEIFNTAYKLKNKGLISQELFIQISLSSAELIMSINSTKNAKTSNAEQQYLITNYLNIHQKFQGLIITTLGDNDVLSSSLLQDLTTTHHQRETAKILEGLGLNLSTNQKAYFNEVTKLAKFFITDNDKEHWLKFCIDLAKDKEIFLQALGTLVKEITILDIPGAWCNTEFVDSYKVETNSRKLLKNLWSKLAHIVENNTNSIEKINSLIQEMKEKVVDFRDPSKFDTIYEYFKSTREKIEELLPRHEDSKDSIMNLILAKQMNDFVNVLDLSIKSMSTSSIYQDKNQQVSNFKQMLQDMFEVAKSYKWIVNTNSDDLKLIMMHIRKMLHGSKEYNSSDLSPSNKFNVNIAMISSGSELQNVLKLCTTLVDVFTLLHQVLIDLSSKATKWHDNIDSPNLLKHIHEELLSISNFGYTTKVSSSYIAKEKYTKNYNIVLDNHSASVSAVYNIDTKATTLKFTITGMNAYKNRWDETALFSAFSLDVLSKIKILQYPKSDNESSEFEVLLQDQNEVNYVKKIITGILERSCEGRNGGVTKHNEKSILIHYLKELTSLQNLESIKAQEDSKIKEFQKKYIKNLWCNIYKSELAYWLEEQGLGLINYLTHNSKLLDDDLTILLRDLIEWTPREFSPIIQQAIKEILINNNIVKDWSEEYIYNMSEVPSDQLVEYITKRPNSILSATVKKDLKNYITNNSEETNNLEDLLLLCQIPQINNDEQLADHLQTLLFKTQEHNIDDLVKYAIDHPYSIQSHYFRNILIEHLKNNLEDIPKCAEVFKSNKVLSRECELKEFHEIYISYLSQKENGLLDYIRLYPKDLESYNLRDLILQELDNNSVELSTVKRYLDNNENINPCFKIAPNKLLHICKNINKLWW